MLDYNLRFANNERPAILTGADVNPSFYPESLNPKYIDLMVNQDIARATSLYANFVIASAFNSIPANFLRFAVFLCSDPAGFSLLSDPSQIIARSHDIFGNALGSGAVGRWVSIPIAPLSSYGLSASPGGLRYLFLGQESYVPTTDWSTGGITAILTQHPLQQKPIDHASGY